MPVPIGQRDGTRMQVIVYHVPSFGPVSRDGFVIQSARDVSSSHSDIHEQTK